MNEAKQRPRRGLKFDVFVLITYLHIFGKLNGLSELSFSDEFVLVVLAYVHVLEVASVTGL